MPRFKVQVCCVRNKYFTFEVDAEHEEEAADKAFDLAWGEASFEPDDITLEDIVELEEKKLS